MNIRPKGRERTLTTKSRGGRKRVHRCFPKQMGLGGVSLDGEKSEKGSFLEKEGGGKERDSGTSGTKKGGKVACWQEFAGWRGPELKGDGGLLPVPPVGNKRERKTNLVWDLTGNGCISVQVKKERERRGGKHMHKGVSGHGGICRRKREGGG